MPKSQAWVIVTTNNKKHSKLTDITEIQEEIQCANIFISPIYYFQNVMKSAKTINFISECQLYQTCEEILKP